MNPILDKIKGKKEVRKNEANLYKMYKSNNISYNIAHFWKQKNRIDTDPPYHDDIRISHSPLQNHLTGIIAFI